MALIKCPECDKEISDSAQSCVHCGYPLNKDATEAKPQAEANMAVIQKGKSPVKDRKIITVITIILSIIPLLGVISFILWRILKSKGKSNVEIKNTIFRTHISVVAVVFIIAIIVSLFATGGGSDSDNRDAWVCAQDVVEEHLKSPSTADFCSYTEATITPLGNNRYEIKGYVDAQNGFGAMVRSYFTVELTLTSSGYKNAKCNIH